jgi:hypothetical protein
MEGPGIVRALRVCRFGLITRRQDDPFLGKRQLVVAHNRIPAPPSAAKNELVLV